MMGSKMKVSVRQQQINLIVAKALFFSTAMSSVGWQRFQNNFYLDKGFTSYEIGTLKSFGLLFKFVGEPFWCFVADLTDPKLVFILSILTSVFSMEMLRVANPLTYHRVLFVKAIRTVTAPAATLTTAASFKLTEGTNEGYGRQRMFGSLAWGSGAFISGVLIDWFGMNALFIYTYFFIAVNFCCVMYGLPSSTAVKVTSSHQQAGHESPTPSPASQSLLLQINEVPELEPNGSVMSHRHHIPPSPSSAAHSPQISPFPVPSSPATTTTSTLARASACISSNMSNICSSLSIYFADMSTFYSVPASRILLINTFVYGLVMTIIDTFMYVSVEKDFGASRTFSGACTAASILSCLPVFYHSEHLLVRYGHFHMILVAQWACVLRLLLLSALDPHSATSMYLLLGIQLFHGLNFALFWSAAVDALFKLAPKGLTSSCLSTLNVMYFTLSGSAGNLLWGYVYDQLGSLSMVYLIGAVTLAAMLLVFQLFEFSVTIASNNSSSALAAGEYPADGNAMWAEDSPTTNGRRRSHSDGLSV